MQLLETSGLVLEAPQTDVISGYGLLRNEKWVLEQAAFKDVAGADSRRGITLSYAYHLRVKILVYHWVYLQVFYNTDWIIP